MQILNSLLYQLLCFFPSSLVQEGDVLPPYYLNPIIRNVAPSVGGAIVLTVVGAGLSIAIGFCVYKGIEYELKLI